MKNTVFIIFLILVAVLAISSFKTYDHYLPERTGEKIYVSTEEELHQAVLNAVPGVTILIRDGVYHLRRPLLIENKSHITICSSSKDSSRVYLIGDGWSDFYSRDRREDDPADPYYARVYNVKTLPTNYLYDPEWNITASNLHGKTLQIKLNQLFNN